MSLAGRPKRPSNEVDEEFARLDALSRVRALTEMESYRLERLIKQIDGRPGKRSGRNV